MFTLIQLGFANNILIKINKIIINSLKQYEGDAKKVQDKYIFRYANHQGTQGGNEDHSGNPGNLHEYFSQLPQD